MALASTAEHESDDQGQTTSSQPSQAPTAAEPRNTNTDETMMGRRAPQSAAREKTAMEKVGVMMWPSWAQRASGLLGPCILEPAGPWTQIPLIELRINRAIGPSGP